MFLLVRTCHLQSLNFSVLNSLSISNPYQVLDSIGECQRLSFLAFLFSTFIGTLTARIFDHFLNGLTITHMQNHKELQM